MISEEFVHSSCDTLKIVFIIIVHLLIYQINLNKVKMSDVNPAVIKLTQQLLGKYVEKPQMSDKLLSKPPFRFLHDVINAVRLFL